MKATLKIRGPLLDEIRRDLARPHAFAHERVGFLTAGAAATPDGILMLVRGYRPVEDDDYEEDARVGAKIGSNAMRKAAQSAYRPAAVLLHIHTHGGHVARNSAGSTSEAPTSSCRASLRPLPACPTACWSSATTWSGGGCGSPPFASPSRSRASSGLTLRFSRNGQGHELARSTKLPRRR